jgi:hypothetical protein
MDPLLEMKNTFSMSVRKTRYVCHTFNPWHACLTNLICLPIGNDQHIPDHATQQILFAITADEVNNIPPAFQNAFGAGGGSEIPYQTPARATRRRRTFKAGEAKEGASNTDSSSSSNPSPSSEAIAMLLSSSAKAATVEGASDNQKASSLSRMSIQLDSMMDDLEILTAGRFYLLLSYIPDLSKFKA